MTKGRVWRVASEGALAARVAVDVDRTRARRPLRVTFLRALPLVVLAFGCPPGLACNGGSDRAASTTMTLTEQTSAGWGSAEPVRLVRAIGYRDGAQTRARFVVADSLHRRLEVDVLIEVNPLPVLVTGAWRDLDAAAAATGAPESVVGRTADAADASSRSMTGSVIGSVTGSPDGNGVGTADGTQRVAASGSVDAEELHFLGGQGGRPSLGGRFTLRSGGGEVDGDAGRDGAVEAAAARFRLFLPPIPLEPVRPGSLD